MKNLFKPVLLLAVAGTFTLTSCTQENPEAARADDRAEIARLAEKYYTPDLPLEESRKVEAALGKLDAKQTELMLEMMRDQDLEWFEKQRRNPAREVAKQQPDGSIRMVAERMTEVEFSNLKKEIDRVYERKKQVHLVAQKEYGVGLFRLEQEQRLKITAGVMGVAYEPPPPASARTASCANPAICPKPSCTLSATTTLHWGILVNGAGVKILVDDPNFDKVGTQFTTYVRFATDGCDGECDLIAGVGNYPNVEVGNKTAAGRTVLNLHGGNGAYLGKGYVYAPGQCNAYGTPTYALWGARRVTVFYGSTDVYFLSDLMTRDLKYRRYY